MSENNMNDYEKQNQNGRDNAMHTESVKAVVNEDPMDMEEGISLSELFSIFRLRFKWFLLVLIITVAAAAAYLYQAVPTYKSTVSVLVKSIDDSSNSIEDMLSSSMAGTSSTKIETEVSLLTSRATLTDALNALDLSDYTNSKGESYDTFYTVPSNTSGVVSVTSQKDTSIVDVSVTDENPQFATDYANSIANSYDSLLTGLSKNSKTVQREFLEKQIPDNEEQLKEASDKLAKYKEDTGIEQLTEQAKTLISQIAYFDLRKSPLLFQQEQAENALKELTNQYADLGLTEQLNIDATTNDEFLQIEDSYKAADRELVMYEVLLVNQNNTSSTTNGSGSLQSVNTRSATLTAAVNQNNNLMVKSVNEYVTAHVDKSIPEFVLREYINNVITYQTCAIKIDVLDANSLQYKDSLAKLPNMERDLAEYQRNVTVLATVGAQLRQMLEEVKLTEAAVSGNVTVIDKAIIPINPVSPNYLLVMAVAFLLGCALGLLMCLFIDFRDNTVKNVAQIRNIVGESVGILGWIPLLSNLVYKNKNKKSASNSSEKTELPSLLVYNNPASFTAERYKSIVSNLLYGTSYKGKSIAITSAGMSEGKTTVMVNMAICLVQLGKKVLLIDGDMRAPNVEHSFHLRRRQTGMVDAILSDGNIEDSILQPIADEPNLHILPVGRLPLVSSMVISNPKFDSMLKALNSYYDYVLFDAPPLGNASELLMLSNKVDSIVINARAGITTKYELSELVSVLKGVSFKISGIILNACSPDDGNFSGSSSRYGYNRYGYGYGYSTDGKDGKKKQKDFDGIITGKKYKKYYKLALNYRNKDKDTHYQEMGKPAFTKDNAPKFTSLVKSYEIIRLQKYNNYDEGFEQVYQRADEIAKSYKVKPPKQNHKTVNDLLSSLEELEGASGKND